MIKPQDISVYVRPEVSVSILGEVEHWRGAGWQLIDVKSNSTIEHLNIKITSHRITLFHPSHKEAFNFEIHFENMKSFIYKASRLKL